MIPVLRNLLVLCSLRFDQSQEAGSLVTYVTARRASQTSSEKPDLGKKSAKRLRSHCIFAARGVRLPLLSAFRAVGL